MPFSIYQTVLAGADRIRRSPTPARRSRSSRPAFLEVFTKAREDLPELETLIVLDGDGGDHTLDELEALDPDFDPAEAIADGRSPTTC